MSTNTLSDETIAKNYLELFKLSEKKYIIGVFHTGITIYKQQVRSLNIFHALIKQGILKKDDPNFSIGIIGAGIAGVTMAAACAKVGVGFKLFERKSIPMHLQYGCDTRVVHPNLYDWPEIGSTFSYAKIPLLQWKSDTASNVAKQIWKEFCEIVDNTNHKNILHKKQFYNFEITNINEEIDGRLRVRYNHDGGKSHTHVNLLIFATGYGIETGIESSAKTPSYWRNDDYGQTILTKSKREYFISGIGDGGLLDLFRIKILGFSIDSLILIIENNPNKDKLANELINIKKEWFADRDKLKPGWLYSKLEDLDPDLYEYIKRNLLKDKLIKQTKVTVHGKEETFEETLSLDKISLLNAFIAFLLSRFPESFEYTNSLIETPDAFLTSDHQKIQGTILIRRGTDRKEITSEKGLLTEAEQDALLSLEAQQKRDSLYAKTPDLLFSYSELYKLLHSGSDRIMAFYTRETQSICSSFVSVLSKGLLYHQQTAFANSNYRVCLHRLIQVEGELGYQQITPYFPVSEATSSKSVGAFHPLSRGLVGLAFKTGNVLMARNGNESSYKKLLENLNLQKEYQNYGQSSVAIPLMARSKKTELVSTNLVCFLESSDTNFFTAKHLASLILYSIEGFVDYVHHSVGDHIVMPDVPFAPNAPSSTEIPAIVAKNDCFVNVTTTFPDFIPPGTGLEFNDLYSFDITYAHLVDYLHLFDNHS